MSSRRALDLVLYGATGFTGKLACEYLAKKDATFFESFHWAIAGRDQKKLESVKSSLTSSYPYLNNLEVLVADSSDMDALDSLTAKCKAVISFAGPYSKFGTNLVESCVKNNTHYADLTGELFWVSEMIDRFDELAKQNRTKLIPCCGFDCLPSDWCAFTAAKLFREQLDEETKNVKTVVAIKGGVSGGTVASGFEMADPKNIAKTMKIMRDPQSLVPNEKKTGLDVRDSDDVIWDPDLQQYLAPFVMAPLNSRVVRRSNAFNNYGAQFTYNEYLGCSSWMRGKANAWNLTIINQFLFNPWLKPVAKRFAPKPGTGPSEDILLNGFARLKFYGESAKTGRKASGQLVINGEPGYFMTARMLVEAGVDLARHSDEMGVYGFRTPCSGLSEKCFEALLQNGFDITVELTE